jgi:PAS domain S-box-containing protein
MSGYTRDELLRLNVAAVEAVEEPAAIAAHIQRLIASGSEIFETRHRRKDCSIYNVEISATYLNFGGGKFVAFCRDITDRKLIEEKLRQSEALYRSIGESIDYGVWICTPDGRNTYASESFLKMVGMTQEQYSNFGWGNVLHPDDAEWTLAAWQECVRTEGKWDIEHRYRGLDNQWHYVLSRGVPVRNELGKITCWAGINLDIGQLKQAEQQIKMSLEEKVVMNIQLRREVAERRKAEEALLALNDELERMVERRTHELQHTQKQFLHAEKLSAIGKLSASIAHEFNNPLQGIVSVLYGLKNNTLLDEEDKSLLEEAIEEGGRIRDLIRSLQEFNRPSSGKKRLLDVHKTLDSVLLLNKNDFRGKRISVELDYAERLPQIEAVPDQIKQVFLNLLTNAADACMHSGGVITVSTRLEGEEKVAVEIKDTGFGIKPTDMDLIFQPFYTTKSEIKGTGLGLSISYGIIKQHRGEISVVSQPGEGSTFTVILPIKGVDDLP